MHLGNRILKYVILSAAMLLAAVYGIWVGSGKENTGHNTPKTYIIAQDGSGDFQTIQEGADYASDGDTLRIYPGVYTEAVMILDKSLNLEGTDKEHCILQYNDSCYFFVPLNIAAGTVSNLTIYGYADEGEEPAQEQIEKMIRLCGEERWEASKEFPGYTVHVESDFLYGRELRFENCRIISERTHCFGIGNRGESRIDFVGCELITLNGIACIFMHDSALEEYGGESRFVMCDCSLKSCFSPYVFQLYSLMPSNTTLFTFQNVKISAAAYEDSTAYPEDNLDNECTFAELDGESGAGFPLNVLDREESREYMERRNSFVPAGDLKGVLSASSEWPEGITYVRAWDTKMTDTVTKMKQQIFFIRNFHGQPAEGWGGLCNAVLTSDSFGNTLEEMNAVY